MKLILAVIALTLFHVSNGEELNPPIAYSGDLPEVGENGDNDDRFFFNFFNNNDDADCGDSTYLLSTESTSGDDRIIGGVIIPNRIQPWAAELYMLVNNTLVSTCTGSLINKQWVLTAAHCVNGYTAENLLVYLGNTSRFEGESFRGIDVKVHESYTQVPNTNDIALIKLDREVTYTDHIKPICLSNKPASEYDFRLGTAAGWGRDSSGSITYFLKQGVLMAAGQELCSQNENYNIDIIPGQMCGYTAYTQDTICQGDSGGPFSIVENKKTYQIGVTSQVATGCGINLFNPNIFADVYYYRSWITNNIGANNNCFLGIFCF